MICVITRVHERHTTPRAGPREFGRYAADALVAVSRRRLVIRITAESTTVTSAEVLPTATRPPPRRARRPCPRPPCRTPRVCRPATPSPRCTGRTRSVGARPGVRVRRGASRAVLQREVLILELLAEDALAAGAVLVGEVTALAHESGDDAVEGRALVSEALLHRAQAVRFSRAAGTAYAAGAP